MLALEAGDILGHVLKAVVIGFGVVMVLFIIRSMKRNKSDVKSNVQSKEASGPERKP